MRYDLILSHIDRMIARAEDRGETDFVAELMDASVEFYKHQVAERQAVYDIWVSAPNTAEAMAAMIEAMAGLT